MLCGEIPWEARERFWGEGCPACSRLLQPAMPHGIPYDVDPALQMEFFHQASLVSFHCFDTQTQVRRNFFVTVGPGNQKPYNKASLSANHGPGGGAA